MNFDSLKEFTGKPIIAWLSYNENYTPNNPDDYNTLIYAFPRFIKENETWELLGADNFQSLGSIDVRLPRDTEASDFIRTTGRLVIVKINDNDFPNDGYLYPKKENRIWYRLHYRRKRTDAEIWIEHFTEVQNFYQIIEVGSSFDDVLKNKEILLFKEIYTKEIFIKSGSFFYGPFRYEKQNDQKISLFSKEEDDNLIKKYSSDDISDFKMDIQDDKNLIAVSLIDKEKFKEIKDDYQEKIDWLSDEDLIKILMNNIKDNIKNKISSEDIEKIKDILSQANSVNLEERREKITGMLDRALQRSDFIQSLCSHIMNTDELKNEFFQNLPEDLDIADNNHYKAKVTELERAKEELDSVKKDLIAKQNDIEKLILTQKDIAENADSTLREENEKLKAENEILKTKIDSIKELEERKQQLESDIRQKNDDYKHLLRMQEEIETQIKESVESIDSSIIASQIDTKLLDGVLKIISGKEIRESTVSHKFNTDLLYNPTPNELIDYIVDTLQNCGRGIKRNDVVNILTCISNGFITTFAGEPGTGKTSLCGLLAKTLGLARPDKNNRFIEVSVERGWTSLKDFIGYYNPLTKTIEKSNIDVFNAIEINEKETDSENRAPLWILLDEANLSSIEHYWANFLRLCDEDSSGFRGINLGGDKQFCIQSNLRFLATVNFDHTTEELSPRFLDRSWIVWLEPTNIATELFFEMNTDSRMVSEASLMEFQNRGKDGNDTLSLNEEKWKNIQTLFREHGYPIMPRNQKMVQKYISAASFYMEVDREQYAPLDYAIAQKILPLINGTGKEYKSLLYTLRDKCGSLPLCQKHLNRIIDFADKNMGYYQFFAR